MGGNKVVIFRSGRNDQGQCIIVSSPRTRCTQSGDAASSVERNCLWAVDGQEIWAMDGPRMKSDSGRLSIGPIIDFLCGGACPCDPLSISQDAYPHEYDAKEQHMSAFNARATIG